MSLNKCEAMSKVCKAMSKVLTWQLGTSLMCPTSIFGSYKWGACTGSNNAPA